MILGILALFTERTGDIISIAVFGAISMYILSCLSIFKLRQSAPEMERPFRVPLYPVFPAVALLIACVAMVAMIAYNPLLAAIYFGTIAVFFVAYKVFGPKD
jgi:ethanolamine permease